MRLPAHKDFCTILSGILLLVFASSIRVCRAQIPLIPASRTVEIWQVQEVKQGGIGWFEVKIDPGERRLPVTLRLQRFSSPGAASFEDGSDELHLERSGNVQVRGIIASDLTRGIALTAWIEGEVEPAATAFFDVVAATPQPRIFWGGRDISDTTQHAVVGQQVLLEVTLHPSLDIRSQRWTIQPQGEYVGGFLHTRARGGPQPVSLNGPTTVFYWLRPGAERKVTYTLTLTSGETVTATALFDVEGPSLKDMVVPRVEVSVGPGNDPSSSYLSFAGKGISFRAHYNLPEGLFKNYTWVQLVTHDVSEVKLAKESMVCTPESQPQAELGVGLDSDYPYDWRNPTRDIPPMPLDRGAEEISRRFQARMYLLWGSGLSNSIVVPLGYVAWHFEGHAVRKDLLTNAWTLEKGSGGADDPKKPYRPTQSYPSWNAVVPYSGMMQCESVPDQAVNHFCSACSSWPGSLAATDQSEFLFQIDRESPRH